MTWSVCTHWMILKPYELGNVQTYVLYGYQHSTAWLNEACYFLYDLQVHTNWMTSFIYSLVELQVATFCVILVAYQLSKFHNWYPLNDPEDSTFYLNLQLSPTELLWVAYKLNDETLRTCWMSLGLHTLCIISQIYFLNDLTCILPESLQLDTA